MYSADKRSSFCRDCTENPETCGKDPEECMKAKEAQLYFKLYDNAKINKYTSIKGVRA